MQTSKHQLPYSSPIFHGDKAGRTIGFPTINLDPTIIPQNTTPGVYAAQVQLTGKNYLGALYFGPRLVKGETHNVLEIFILDFSQEIYGETAQFSILQFVRPVMDFSSLEELKSQLQKDIAAVRTTTQANSVSKN